LLVQTTNIIRNFGEIGTNLSC